MEPTGINIEQLLQPIDTDNPQGIDVRDDTDAQVQYYDLKEMRQQLQRQQQDALLNGELIPSSAPWEAVVTQATTLLTEYTKDLEIAAWLVEALVQQQGFSGFIDGINLLNELIDQYNDTLYPADEEDEEDEEYIRLLPLTILSGNNQPGTLVTALNLTPLFTVDADAISTWDIQQAGSQQSQKSVADLTKLIDRVAEDNITARQESLQQAEESIARLETTLDKHYGHHAPSLRQLKEAIGTCQQAFKQLLPEAQPEVATDSTNDNEAKKTTAPEQRSTAITAIQTALQYYQMVEPHSPINYLLQRSLRWAQTDLTTIFNELIAHDEIKLDLARVLGMPMPNLQRQDHETDSQWSEDDG